MLARSLQHNLAPFAVACLAIAIFSGMDALMKGLSMAIGAYDALLWRSIAGMALMTPIFLLRERRIPGREALLLHLFRGGPGAISVLLFFWGLKYTPLAQGIALSFIAPLIALGLAAMFLKERIGRRAVAGSAIAFAGVLLILAPSLSGKSGTPEGAMAILAAAVLYAVNLVLGRRQSQVAGPIEVALAFNIVATAVYVIVIPIATGLFHAGSAVLADRPWTGFTLGWPAAVPDTGYFLAILLAAVSSSVSIMLLAWAYARAEAQYLVSVEYTGFIWAAILGWIVFSEQLRIETALGAALIVGGCLWAARGSKPADVPMTGPEAA